MRFVNDIQKACFEKVLTYVKSAFGDGVAVADDAPAVSVTLGSAVAVISVLPLAEDEAMVTARSIVVTGARFTPELGVFLLRANATTLFGAFGLTARGDIVFEHNLAGSTLDPQELSISINTVVRLADHFDDLIVERWGGERALDRIDSFARLLEHEPPGAVSH